MIQYNFPPYQFQIKQVDSELHFLLSRPQQNHSYELHLNNTYISIITYYLFEDAPSFYKFLRTVFSEKQLSKTKNKTEFQLQLDTSLNVNISFLINSPFQKKINIQIPFETKAREKILRKFELDELNEISHKVQIIEKKINDDSIQFMSKKINSLEEKVSQLIQQRKYSNRFLNSLKKIKIIHSDHFSFRLNSQFYDYKNEACSIIRNNLENTYNATVFSNTGIEQKGKHIIAMTIKKKTKKEKGFFDFEEIDTEKMFGWIGICSENLIEKKNIEYNEKQCWMINLYTGEICENGEKITNEKTIKNEGYIKIVIDFDEKMIGWLINNIWVRNTKFDEFGGKVYLFATFFEEGAEISLN